ncbi:MAG: SRPBCC family protein [Hyphomonadaceae bacterium]|nr:SRPBCC family protein [Hyphomonadaceae bacterium]
MQNALKAEARGDREVVVMREFKAPRQLVWDAHTKPELVKRWMLGPDGWSMPVCEMDVRVGGKYRWRWKSDENGQEFGFFGEFREVNAPAKIVHTEYFDQGDLEQQNEFPAGEPAIITQEYSEANGRTLLTTIMLFASKESRDGAVATGMTDGMEIGYKRLDEMFAK